MTHTLTLPPSVKFDPPIGFADPTPPGVTMPACPACGDGTVYLTVCGKCGSTSPGPHCCGEYPLIRGAFVSTLPGNHSWLGCALMASAVA